MNRKMITRLFHLSALLILPLASCRGEETPPIPQMPTGTYSETIKPLFSPTPATPSPTPTLTATDTGTLTPTRNPAGYTLKYWHEPVEVITPENLDRVEKIGELEFSGGVMNIAWSPDGSWFGAIASGSFVILDGSTFNYRWSASGQIIAFSYDGLLLETGIYRYDLTTGENLTGEGGATLYSYPNNILDGEFSPDGKFIAAGGTAWAQVYPMKPGIEGGEFGRYPASSIYASISSDSRIVAINYDIETFTELWDPYLRQPIRRLKLKDISGQGKPRFSRDGKSLFVIGREAYGETEATYLQEWDYRTGEPLDVQIMPGLIPVFVTPMDISQVSRIVAIGTIEGNIYLLPMRDCLAVKIRTNDKTDDPIHEVAFRPDGMVLATEGNTPSNIIEFWGIPASEARVETDIPTVDSTDIPTTCPKIPMIVENPTPEYDWFGGGRPYPQ